jgi:hypothetical protein
MFKILWLENLHVSDHVRHLGSDGKMLKSIFRKQGLETQTRFTWLQDGPFVSTQ